MFKVAPFETAIDALKIMNELAIVEYQKQAKESVEFVVTFDEFTKILALLSKSMNDGTSIPAFQKDLKLNEILLPKDLAETLRRTVTNGAYAAGRWKQAQMAKKLHPYLRYVSVNDDRITPCCNNLSGIIRPIDDIFWATHLPPNHPNCRSITTSLTEKEAIKRSDDDQGLNKFITCKMKPDEGWDFNVGENLDAFVKVGIVGLVRKDAVYRAC